MRALADHGNRSRNHHARLRPGKRVAAAQPSAPDVVAARPYLPLRASAQHAEAARVPALTELPVETDAWWLSRGQQATFARRRIALPDACARALRAGDAAARIVVEFNGARFEGATLAADERRCELDLGEALAQEMAEVLDEDDGLEIVLVAGRGQPTLAIHPFVSAGR